MSVENAGEKEKVALDVIAEAVGQNLFVNRRKDLSIGVLVVSEACLFDFSSKVEYKAPCTILFVSSVSKTACYKPRLAFMKPRPGACSPRWLPTRNGRTLGRMRVHLVVQSSRFQGGVIIIPSSRWCLAS